jgi:oligopeptidase B
VPERRPARREVHGDVFVDPYVWLRDADDPAVLDHLRAENAHTEAVLAPLADRRERIFGEIKARTQETDLSVPHRKGAWWYFSRTEEGKAYPIHCRHPDGDPAAEEVLLDQNELAEGHEYTSVGVLDVSPDGRRLAYSVDHQGDEAHVLQVRDLETGDLGPEAIANTYYGFAWAADPATCFYTTLDAAKRPFRVHRHRLGAPPEEDAIVFEEDDERFHVGVGATRSEALVVIGSASAVTSELWLIDARRPFEPARVVEPRRQGVEYSLDHRGDHLFVLSNHGDAPNFALWRAPLERPGAAHWEPVLAHDARVRLEGVDCFVDHVVLRVRRDGLTRVRVLDPATGAGRDLDAPEPVFTMHPGSNEEFVTSSYRFGYQSLVTPASVLEEDLAGGTRRLLKRQPVLGGFDPADYESARLWAPCDDGTQVPVSLVWRRGTRRDGTAPCVLYGYGAYEISSDPWFSVARLSLLDRGVVFAIAHVRGGGELGRRWYEEGKLLAKPNSFTDFVACGRHLVAEGWTSPDRLAARGASAGGLLVGAVANRAPDLFRAVVAEVPFVDALSTMLDPALPLTVTEREEWGDPAADPDVYSCMRGYTPYENVAEARYPAVLATAGLHDPRVGYHEPAKWVAELRTRTVEDPDRPVLLRTDLGAGHGGPSGRYATWRDEALVLSFLLDQLGVSG